MKATIDATKKVPATAANPYPEHFPLKGNRLFSYYLFTCQIEDISRFSVQIPSIIIMELNFCNSENIKYYVSCFNEASNVEMTRQILM